MRPTRAVSFATAMVMLGATVLALMVPVPAFGWSVGFVMRNVKNHHVHSLGIRRPRIVRGATRGRLARTHLGVEGLSQKVAPTAGIGAAPGGWSTSRFAKV